LGAKRGGGKGTRKRLRGRTKIESIDKEKEKRKLLGAAREIRGHRFGGLAS